MHVSHATEEKLTQLELELDRLRTSYEQYFAGINRAQPVQEHEDLKRKIYGFKMTDLASTSQRFRYTNVKARYNQLNSLWIKVCKQIEEGTFVREKTLQKMKSKYEEKDISPSIEKSSKEESAIEALYLKLQDSQKGAKIMAKDKFKAMMSEQLKKFKELNPQEAFRFRMAKDKSGQFKIKIEKKSKA